jgi:hypothetical protein
MKWTPETGARSAIEGAGGRLHGEGAPAALMACSVGIPPAWWMRAPVLLNELIHPELCG